MDLEGSPEGRLGELLSAAAAPGRPYELAGEAAAVAGFRAAYRPAARHRRRRLVALAVAAVTAVSVGGTAFAATTGHLPAPVRSWLDFEEAPPPASTSAARSPDQPRSASAAPSAAAASGSPSASASAPVSAVEACRAFVAFRNDPHAGQISSDQRKALTALAGNGEKAIEEYCDRLLGVTPSPTPAATATATVEKKSKPSHTNKNS
ncbi:hypothetical protein [Dactylosporangium sp. NPDC048998]|uniref:hypothetical protein n=1 Tax=Dactylosporangium sp. NPDC048998 TaxID=3363976 RepID=UPI003718A449